ncbi:efflux transporter outer membrane subunit [Pseudomonas aeruginosa]|nr:efflux transporter outer membrane subunit [Pseudomonas aeruginosa]
MKSFALVSRLAIFGALAACTQVGPDYHLPEQSALRNPAVSKGFGAAHGSEFSLQPVPDGWWRLYQDSRLNTLVEQGLSANTDLRVASANLRRAMAVESSVDADGNPHVTLAGTAQRHQESIEESPLGVRPPVLDDGNFGFRVGYEIDLFGKLARAEEAARYDTQASEAALDLVRITVAAEIVRAYVQNCSATAELAVATHQLELQLRSVDVTQRLVSAGRGSVTDVERARGQAETLQANLPRFRASQDAARFRLADLLALAPSQLSASAVDCKEPPQLSQSLPVGDGAALLKRRPDVRQAERQLAGMTARIGVATAELYPSVSLGASAGVAERFGQIGNSASKYWSLGPLISWTIPDSGARARVTAAEVDSEAALAHFDGIVLNALRETETALTIYSRELQRNASLKAARDHSQRAARDSDRLYAVGRLPYLASLDANRVLASSEADLAASNAQLLLDQVNLFLALGGSWTRPASETGTEQTATDVH